jgi:hypothetical protein
MFTALPSVAGCPVKRVVLLGRLSLFKRKMSAFIFLIRLRRANGQQNKALNQCLGHSFYYVNRIYVKLANKRLIKTIGFDIRMPIPNS